MHQPTRGHLRITATSAVALLALLTLCATGLGTGWQTAPGVPLLALGTGLVCLLITFRDVTGRRRTAEVLRLQSAALQAKLKDTTVAQQALQTAKQTAEQKVMEADMPWARDTWRSCARSFRPISFLWNIDILENQCLIPLPGRI